MEHATVPALETQWSSVTPVLEQSLWSNVIRERLKVLRSLPENWNSHGSAPVSETVVGTSLALIGNFKKLNMPDPDVFPVAGGGLQLEWRNDKCELEIEIRPNKTIEFLIVDRNGEMSEDRIASPDDSKIGCLTYWFLEEKSSVKDLLNLKAHAYR